MKPMHLFRRGLALLLTLLMILALPIAQAAKPAETPLTRLAGELMDVGLRIDQAEADKTAADEAVAALEAEYETASGSRLVSVQDELIDAMLVQEDADALLQSLYDERMGLYDELDVLIEEAGCTEYTIEAKGYNSDLTIYVTLDADLTIYDLAIEVKGDERDAAVSGMVFTVQFMGKQLPLDVKADDIQLPSGARVTGENVVDALNTLVPDADPQGPITDPQGIADYLFRHGELPDNFITKREAQRLGWDSSYNYVSDVAPGKSIGGDRFGNYEGQLPDKKGRTWYEADCYYTSGKRNAHRIVYSNDGLVYYTSDHYETFTEMKPSWK